jgi:hypothetical protein
MAHNSARPDNRAYVYFRGLPEYASSGAKKMDKELIQTATAKNKQVSKENEKVRIKVQGQL